MEFTEQKITKIMIGASIVIALAVGSHAFYSRGVDAKEADAKQIVMDNIDKQQSKELDAYKLKSGNPVVSEEYPARIVPEAVSVPVVEAKPVTTPETKQTNSTVSEAPKKIPQQSPAPPKVAPKEVTPPPNPQEPVQAITTLSEADIQRLQRYPQYGEKGAGFYEGFNDFYAKERSNAEGFPKRFSPTTLSAYNKAKVEWLTSPKLVYRSVIGQICIRGILTLTYYGDNSFDLTPNVTYQREVEYRLDNSVKNGSVSLSLDSTHYLSGFQAVK